MKSLSALRNKLLNQKTESLPSSETNTGSFVSAQAPTNPHHITLHRSCKTLPLTAFIDAYCNQDYSGLGTGTPQEITEAWQEILFDWGSLVHTEMSTHIFELAKRIGVMQAHVLLVENAVKYLNIEWDEDIAGLLIAEGYDPKDLNRTLSMAKRVVFDLNEAQDEYNRLTKTVGGKKMTEDEFQENIQMLIKWRGVTIDPDTTTVKVYANIINMYIKQNKAK